MTVAAPAAATWHLAPLFMMRVGGLPIGVVARLRCPDAVAWAAETLSLESVLAAEGAALGDALHDLIGGNDDERSRRDLLALRRQAFNNTLPPDPDRACAAVRRADPALVPAVTGWLRRRARLDSLRAAGAAILDADVAATRGRLWDLLAEPRLRGGLQVASTVFDQQLAAMARADGTLPAAKRIRRIERSALSYLYRTACKTSPFSTFTGVALGEFGGECDDGKCDDGKCNGDNDEGGDGWAAVLGDEWDTFVRLNVVVIGRLAELISAEPRRRGDLRVTLSPGWRRDDARVRYVRRWVTPGDDGASVSFDAVRDSLFFLRRSDVLDALTTLFAQRPAPRCHEVVTRLAATLGAPPADAEQYLATLLALGMLRLDGLGTDVHAPDPLRALRDSLRRVGRAWAHELAARLDEPIELIDAYHHAGLDQRRDIGAALRHSLHAIARHLGDGTKTLPLPHTLLYEDARASATPVPASAARWQDRFGADLARIERVLPAFDLTLPHRIMLRGFFLARFGPGGRCDDLLALVDTFHDDLYDQYASYTAGRRPFDEDGHYTPEENWLGRPEIVALDRARQLLAGHVRDRFATGHEARELHLDPDALAAVAGELAAATTGPRPQGHFVQLAVRPDGPLLVLNQSFGGLSFPFSRFTHCFDENGSDGDGAGGGWTSAGTLAATLRAHAAASAPPGAVFAEVTGGPATTNLNLHGQLTDYVIVCPGETSTAAAASQITLDDLYLIHDETTDRVTLRSARLDRDVIPVYLGYLMPMALPHIPRTLLLLSPASLARLDAWAGVPPGPATGGVTYRPRVRVGDVVVSRRSWTTRAGDLPIRAAGATDAGWFLGWQRWAARHGLPRRVFGTVYADRATSANPKPQYLDLDSYLSLLAFEALLTGPHARVVLREALPDEDDLVVRSSRGSHAAEYAIETYTTIDDADGGSRDGRPV